MHFIQYQGERCVVVVLAKCVLVLRESDGQRKHLLSSSTSTGVIVASSVHDNGMYLCCAYSDKTVACWDLSGDGVQEHSYKAAKKPTAIVCSNYGFNAALLVSDKFGDVYATDLPAMRKQIKLLGHTASVVTDMLLLPDCIVTSDRDEKIRITKYPQTSVISSYCLSHTDVVSSLCLSGDLLLSAGLDHRICAWKCSDFSKLSECVLDTLPTAEIAENEEDEDVEGGDVEQEGEEEEEVVEEDDRVDAAAAGHFPCRLTAAPRASLAFAILRNSNRVKVLSSAHGIVQDAGVAIELPAVPVDCAVREDCVLFLLPKPHYLAAYSVSRNENGDVELKSAGAFDAWTSSIAAAVQEQGNYMTPHYIDTHRY